MRRKNSAIINVFEMVTLLMDDTPRLVMATSATMMVFGVVVGGAVGEVVDCLLDSIQYHRCCVNGTEARWARISFVVT